MSKENVEIKNIKQRRFVCGDIHGAHKALVQVLERSGFDYENDMLITLGDIVDGWGDSFMCVEELLKIKNRIDIVGNHDCLDIETEVFTKRGWLKYNQLNELDYVLGINKLNNLSEWQNINEVIIKNSNHLNYYSNSRIDFAMTDNHRIIHQLKSGKYEYKTISDLKFNDRLKIPLGCKNNNIENVNFSDDEIKLTAWILTDGGITKKHGYVTIYQSKVENLKHIENILKSNSLKYTHSKRNRKTKSILGKKIKSIKESNEFHLLSESSKFVIDKLINKNKEIPNWCYDLSQRQLEIFLKEIIRGDGSKYDSDNYILYGTKNFLETIQPLFNMGGYSSNLTQSNRLDYRLNISYNNISVIRQDLNKIKRIVGDFKVWCLNVRLSNFLVRRNNKSYFTGNCWFDNFCQIGIHPDGWAQGGLNTAMSYAKGVGVELKYTKKYSRSLRSNRVSYILNLNSADIPETHKDFFYKQIRCYKDDDKNVFVHGGFMRSLPLNDSHKDFMMWDRKLWSGAKSAEGTKTKLYIEEEVKNIFIGHTTTMMWDTDKPMKADVIWNLDTGAGGGGKLTLMDVDSHEYWQSDLIPDLYPDDEHNNRK